MVCKLCKHPRIGEIEGLVKAGRLDIADASRELDAHYQETWKHFNECIKPPTEEKEFQEYLSILRELVMKLKHRIDDIEDVPTNLLSVKMLTSLIKELRGVVRDLGTLEGRLQSGTLIQLTNITVRYEKLTSLMFSNLCDNCRMSLIQELEKLETPSLQDMR